ncbi:MAG: SH3 domain-containing protein [Desulfurivibrio sp.]|nr:SH3 domain-containing protein [Desulfurivibrio sp.]
MSNSTIRPRFLCFLGLLVLLVLTLPALAAAEYVSVEGEKVNIRSGPGTDQEILWQVFAGYPLQVLERRGDWTHIIDFEDDKGWIYTPLLGGDKRLIVQVDTANMRVGPGTNYEVMATVRYGVVFEPLERRRDWLKVEHADGTTGWIAARLLWPADII